MNTYPILFQFRDIVAGNGFLARVAIDGRALLKTEDDGDCWVDGVQPAALAAGADATEGGMPVALNNFKESYQRVLYDFANDAATFDEFQTKVTEFFDTIDSDTTDWANALEEIRKTSVSIGELQAVKAETQPPRLHVSEVKTARPSYNEIAEIRAAA